MSATRQLGQAQQVARVDQHAVAVIARGAQDALAVEQPDVDDFCWRLGGEWRQRPDVVTREACGGLGLGRQSQMASGAECAAGAGDIEPPVGRDHSDVHALAIEQDQRLDRSALVAAGGPCFVDRGVNGVMLDELGRECRCRRAVCAPERVGVTVKVACMAAPLDRDSSVSPGRAARDRSLPSPVALSYLTRKRSIVSLSAARPAAGSARCARVATTRRR